MRKPASSTGRRSGKGTGARARVELRTVGPLQVLVGGVDLTERMGARHQALFAYLVHEGRPVFPSELIELVGRGGAEDAELAGLKKALAWLAENIPSLRIELARDSVALSTQVWWDVRELDEALDRRDFNVVARLYRGDFLEEFSCGNAAFDNWAREQRRQLRDYWDDALRAAAVESEAAERWPEAGDWWRLQADRNPLAGDLVVRAMRAYGRAKQRDEAARVYEAYLARVAAQRSAIDSSVEQVAADLSIPRPTRPAQGAAPPPPRPRKAGSKAAAKPPRRGTNVVEPRPRPEPAAAGRQGSTAPLDSTAERVASVGSVSFGPPTSRASTDPGAVYGFDEVDHGTDSDIGDVTKVSVVRETPRHLRRERGSEVFTDSYVIYGIKTGWARLTTPRAVTGYKNAIEQFIQTAVLAAQSALYWIGVGGQHAWTHGVRFARAAGRRMLTSGRRTAVRTGRAIGTAGRATARGASAATAAGGRAGRRAGGGMARGVALAFRPLLAVPGLVLAALRLVLKLPRVLLAMLLAVLRLVVIRPMRSLTGSTGGVSRSVGRGLAHVSRPGSSKRYVVRPTKTPREPARATRSARGAASARATEPARATVSARTTAFIARGRGAASAGRQAYARLGRRRAAIVAGAAAVLALVLAIPIAGDAVGGLVGGTRARLASLSDGGLPKVTVPTVTVRKPSLPKVTLPKPDIAGSVPDLVKQPVERLGAMLAGPLVDWGQRVIVADVSDGRPSGGPGLGHLAALLLEAELAGSPYFSVVPRERALLADGNAPRSDFALRGSEAISLAAKAHVVAVVTGRFDAGEDGSLARLKLAVLDAATATEAYGFEIDIVGGDWIAAVEEAAQRLAGRLGNSDPAAIGRASVLSASLPALGAYSRGRAALFAGRYDSAEMRLREAVAEDTAFATGYQLLARAEALRGRPEAAQAALEAAHRHRERLSGREKLRVLADLEAMRGRYTDAIIAYEYLFRSYRDDVVALKSLALLQRRVGVRGGGMGNLQVAYSIEPVDWPSLRLVARYIGYGGSLPSIAALDRGGSVGMD